MLSQTDRIRIYIKAITRCLLAIALVFIVSLFIRIYSESAVFIFAIFGFVLVLAGFHIKITKAILLIRNNIKFAIPVIFTSFLLISCKVWVNETKLWGCMSQGSPSGTIRLLNYTFFFFWTSIMIWEIYIYIKKNKQGLVSGNRNVSTFESGK